MSGSTDIRTYIRKGRLLWPRYIEPLRPPNIQTTFSTMGAASPSKADVVGYLDQLMLPHWRPRDAKEQPLEFPKLGKYLLLAAFICQSNHHDSDKNLFLTQRNGRRRKKNETQQETQPLSRTTSNSRACFPLERLFSVYVSIVSLNERQQQMAVGDLEFFDRLAYLKDLRILQKKGQGWMCTITAAKAFAVAESIHFSLGNYVKRNES
jgi:Origin recognition complex (ORC) subunit 5 C-terminus